MEQLQNPVLLPSTASSTASKADQDFLRQRMKMLFSAYRLDQYPEPEGFMAQAAMVLADYPCDVIAYVTDPRTGIQRTNKFPPTISEMTEACESKVAAIHRQKELDDWHERKRKSDEVKANAPRYSVQENDGFLTYGQFLKRCGELKMEARPRGRFER